MGIKITPQKTIATDPIWAAKGDVVAATGANAAAKTTLGTDGYVLTADSTQTNGIKWAAATSTTTFLTVQVFS